MYFDEFTLGMKKELDPAVIDKNDMLDFALKYDNVPLHTDEEYAKNTNFGRIIAPGVMSFMSVWAKYLEVDYFGEELIAGMSTKIEWMAPVFAGDTLTGTAEITKLTERSAKNGIVELTITVVNQEGKAVLKDTTEALVKRKMNI